MPAFMGDNNVFVASPGQNATGQNATGKALLGQNATKDDNIIKFTTNNLHFIN